MILDDLKYPGDIIESVHWTALEAPQIKIRFANAEEEDADTDASITIDLGSDNEEDNEDEDHVSVRPKRLPKSKPEDIHSFL